MTIFKVFKYNILISLIYLSFCLLLFYLKKTTGKAPSYLKLNNLFHIITSKFFFQIKLHESTVTFLQISVILYTKNFFLINLCMFKIIFGL